MAAPILGARVVSLRLILTHLVGVSPRNMAAPSEVLASDFSEQLDLPPSCVEFCPAHPSYFLVGTYNLQQSDAQGTDKSRDEDEDAVDPTGEQPGRQRQNRDGSIVVFRLADGRV